MTKGTKADKKKKTSLDKKQNENQAAWNERYSLTAVEPQMKSPMVMKSSFHSDEIFSLRLQMKLNPLT